MEFIIADENREDLGTIHQKAYLDLDIGDTNDFKLKVRLAVYDPEIYAAGHFLYSIGTEYGGILNDPEVSTRDGYISFTGDTFRGMLEKKLVEPDAGSDYLTISGDLNACLKQLLGEQFGTVFTVSDEVTGVLVTAYKIPGYSTLIDAITGMFRSVDYRLNIECQYDSNEKMVVMFSAVPITDYSEEIETSQDSKIHFTIKQYTNKYNYMISLIGKDDVRTKNYYRLNDDGTVSQVTKVPKGIDVRVYLYESSSTFDTDEELLEDIKEKFNEINNTDTQKMTVKDDMQLELGDIIGGRDYITNMVIKQAISQKIVKLQNGSLKISYKVGDGD